MPKKKAMKQFPEEVKEMFHKQARRQFPEEVRDLPKKKAKKQLLDGLRDLPNKQVVKRYSNEYIYQSLIANGNKIEYYVIFKELIYVLEQGRTWFVMLTSDDYNVACVRFLKKNGVSIFTEDTELDKYEAELKAKLVVS